MKIMNTYHIYPDLDSIGVGFLAVLTQDGIGQYTVYSGIVKLPSVYENDAYAAARQRGAEKVVRHGSKEGFKRAKTFYPFLEKELYRG